MSRKTTLFVLPLVLFVAIASLTMATQGAAKTVWDGLYTANQATSGQAIYTEHCATCHSTNLLGGANQGAPPLKGDRFMENWREDTLDSLFTKIRTTMPRRDPKSLSEKETVDLVAYILQSNDFPAGTELAANNLNALIQRKDGPKPLPNYAIVQVVGCMTADGDNWALTKAGQPARIRNADKSTPEELQAASAKPLGDRTFRLQNLAMLGAFNADAHKGHKMVAKGSLIRSGTSERISVSELEMIAENCGQ